MTFVFGNVSQTRLKGVHPDLVRVVEKALSYGIMDFSVVQGVRTQAEQDALYAQGRTTKGPVVTWTRKSNHLVQPDGYGHAVDLAPYDGGKINWDNAGKFYELAKIMMRAASELGVKIRWGGNFSESKRDLPHFELLT